MAGTPSTPDSQESPRRAPPANVRTLLIVLLVVAFVPMLIVESLIFVMGMDERRDAELRANMEIARSVASAFEAQLRSVLRQQLALGLALTREPSASPAEARRLLVTAAGDYASVLELEWVDPTGRIIATSGSWSEALELTNQPAFEKIRGGDEWAVSALLPGSEERDPVFFVARGVRSPTGELLGIVSATLIPERLARRALSLNLERGRHVFLIDQRGVLVQRWPATEVTWPERSIPSGEMLVQQAIAGQPGSGPLRVPGSNDPELAGLAPIPSVGWVAGASRAQSLALAELRALILRHGLITLAVALAAFVLALALGRRITEPIEALEKYARAGRKEAHPELPLDRGPGEVRRLAAAFAAMEHRVGAHEADLERRRAEAEHSRALLEALLETLPAGVFVADPEGRIILQNAAAREVGGALELWNAPALPAGYALLDHQGKPVARDEAPLARALLGRESGQSELVLRTPDGKERVLLAAASAVKTARGEVTGAVLVFQDITARRKVELERARLSEELRLLLESTGEGILGVDLEGRCTFINRMGAAQLGWTPEELIGQDVHTRIHHHRPDGTIYPASECLMEATTERAESGRLDETLWRRDGTPLPVAYSSYPVREDGALKGAVVTFTDISARKQAEGERTRLVEELEAVLSTVSHDLRTPLTVVMTQADALARLLRDLPRDDRRIRRLEGIRTGGRRMNAMIQDLVDAARLDTQQLQLSLEPVDLPDFLEELCRRLAGALPMERVRRVVDGAPPKVAADPNRLERIVTNLLDNALKYTTGTVTLRTSEAEGGAEVAVSDEGPGIPAELEAQLFERYRRGEGQTGDGLGLGLSICKRLVEAHGGRIRLHDRPGPGAELRFTLPRAV